MKPKFNPYERKVPQGQGVENTIPNVYRLQENGPKEFDLDTREGILAAIADYKEMELDYYDDPDHIRAIRQDIKSLRELLEKTPESPARPTAENESKMQGFGATKMKDMMKKFAENKAKREESLYSMEEDWSVYGPNCADHAGVRKLLVGEAEKVKLGYKRSALVWKCPVDGKITAAEGTIAEQTDGFAAMNNLHRNSAPIQDEAFKAAKDLAKAMGYESDGPKGN